ncbi:MAG: hypothetical protein QXJ97_10725 [Desulfurococcaceae archaeon]
MECGSCTENRVNYFSISMMVHARGIMTEPKLYVLFDKPTSEDLTLSVYIGDLSGRQISDVYTTTIPAGTGLFVRELGDFIDAQRLAKSIPPGIYTIVVLLYRGTTLLDMSGFTMFLVDSVFSISLSEEVTDVIVLDKITGLSTRMSKYHFLPADPRYTVFVVYRRGNLGRLEVYDAGLPTVDTGYHRYVQVRIRKKFTSIDQMIDYVFSNAYMPLAIAREVLREMGTGDKSRLVKALMPYYTVKNTMVGYVGSAVDVENLEVIDEFLMFFGWFNWDDFAKSLISGLAVTGCLVGAGAFSVKTFGAGVPLAVALVKGCITGGFFGAGIGFGLNIVRSYFIENTSPVTPIPQPPPPPPPPEEIEEYRQRFEESKAEMESYLTQWKDQGRITLEEYETAMKHLTQMREMYESTIRDLKDYAETIYKKAWEDGYREGYARGQEEERKRILPYLATSGAVGIAIGVLIGRR